MEAQRKLLRPTPNGYWLQRSAAAPTRGEGELVERVIGYNMVSKSKIGREAFALEITDAGMRLVIEPPLTAAELRVMSQVPYFREVILKEGTNG